MTDFAKNNVATPMVEARPMPVARYSVVGLDTMVQWRDFLHTMAKDHKALQVARQAAGAACEAREAQLTKPPHSLGRLELLTRWFYETHGVYDSARAGRPADIIVFAGNHGVAARGVSAFPSSVTSAMVHNFQTGGAGINQLAAWCGARLRVVQVNELRPTADFTNGPAMTEQECCAALRLGFDSVAPDVSAVILGEMGIANSTAAAAISAALFGGAVETWVGSGTGVDEKGLTNKKNVVADGLAAWQGWVRAAEKDKKNIVATGQDNVRQGLEILQFFAGFEMVALVGAMIAAIHYRLPLLLDSYATTAPFACLAREWAGYDQIIAGVMAPHQPSGWRATMADQPTDIYHGHALLLQHLGKEPLVDLNLRLGEGTGGAIAWGLVRAALTCHHGMATFAEAGVAEKIN